MHESQTCRCRCRDRRSAHRGGWRIFRHDLEATTDTLIAQGIQPAVSPDGLRIAFERGLCVLDLAPGSTPVLVRDEDTEYRMEPAQVAAGEAVDPRPAGPARMRPS